MGAHYQLFHIPKHKQVWLVVTASDRGVVQDGDLLQLLVAVHGLLRTCLAQGVLFAAALSHARKAFSIMRPHVVPSAKP